MTALFNGQPVTGWIHSRGLHFGDGVFRTLLIWQGEPLDWDLHMQKLDVDCAKLGLRANDRSQLRQEVAQIITTGQTAVLKILVIRRSQGRGYRPATDATDRILLLQEPPHYPLKHWTEGIRAFRCPLQLSAQPALAGVKHLNRLEQVLASAQWPGDVDEGLLFNQHGQAICGTRSNLFWVNDRRLYTPSLDQCGVAGVMRERVLNAAQQLGLVSEQISICEPELLAMEELFVCNALIGIWPITSIGEKVWRAPGAVTQSLQNFLGHPKLTQ